MLRGKGDVYQNLILQVAQCDRIFYVFCCICIQAPYQTTPFILPFLQACMLLMGSTVLPQGLAIELHQANL